MTPPTGMIRSYDGLAVQVKWNEEELLDLPAGVTDEAVGVVGPTLQASGERAV